MLEMVQWIESIEWMACRLYEDAAARFDDKALCEFLDRLARDEAWHAHLMAGAVEYVRTHAEAGIASAVALNDEVRAHVETPLHQARDSLARGELSERQMIEYVVTAEFSEWNTLFVYAINTLKAYSRQFQYGAAAVQAHEHRIEEFLRIMPAEMRPSRDIRELPRVWETRFLIVDDEQPLRDLFSRLLCRRGTVETAGNGAEALAMVRRTFYNVIVTDVNMPVMDGMEFYRQAVADDPSVRLQFLFHTGALTLVSGQFLEANHLPYLVKPFALSAMTEMIDKILHVFPEPLH